jgi:hypothetical protein
MRKAIALGAVLCLVVAAGCVMPTGGAVFAPIMDTKSTIEVGDTTVGMDNVGRATVEGIILLASGDASLSAAMANGSKGPITKIHHVDAEEKNILSIYCTKTIVVYGE